MMKHSKLPFKAVFEPDDMNRPWVIRDSRGYYICEFIPNSSDKENAEFLAVAANSYYPMLEALKDIADLRPRHEGKVLVSRMRSIAKRVIKQAEDK